MDTNTFNVLLYLDKHSGRVPYSKFKDKFRHLKNPTLEEIERWLFINKFAYLCDYTEVNNLGDPLNPQTIALTIKGKQELEKYLYQRRGDLFARVLAIIALLISLASLLLQFFIEL